jgi:hypothetical protein
MEAFIPAIEPKLEAFYTLGLPGADQPPRNIPAQESMILPGFPTPEYGLRLFESYKAGVAIYYNVVHPVSISNLRELNL